MNAWYGSSTSTGSFSDLYQRAMRGQQLGRQAALKVKMEPRVTGDAILAFADKAAREIWPDAPAGTARPIMAVLLASIAREVQRRGQAIEFVIERDGYKQSVEPVRPPPPADGEWPVAWFAVIDSQRERLSPPVRL